MDDHFITHNNQKRFVSQENPEHAIFEVVLLKCLFVGRIYLFFKIENLFHR